MQNWIFLTIIEKLLITLNDFSHGGMVPMAEQRSNKSKNVMLRLMYDGTNYNGWQRSNSSTGKIGIQGLIEQILSQQFGEPIRIHGSGRTDAGVHALGQVCNFKTAAPVDVITLPAVLNQKLPEDIKVTAANKVSDTFHARYDAIFKVYEYRIDVRERENVFLRKYAYPAHGNLDIVKMREAAEYLIGTHDFMAFSTDRKDGKTTVRTIYGIKVFQTEGEWNEEEVRIEICGDGFLHHMIRIIAGTLLEVGNGQRSVESVKDALISRQRNQAGVLLYPQGLFLNQVGYGNDVWDKVMIE